MSAIVRFIPSTTTMASIGAAYVISTSFDLNPIVSIALAVLGKSAISIAREGFKNGYKHNLYSFIAQKDMSALGIYLEMGGSIKDTSFMGLSLIEYCIKYGTPEIVEFLLSKERKERDLDPEHARLCIKGLENTSQFSEMIRPILAAGIHPRRIQLDGKKKDFINVLIERDLPEIALDLLRKGDTLDDVKSCQLTIAEKIVTRTDDEKTAKYLDLYKELFQHIKSKIEDDVQAYTEGHPVVFDDKKKIELANLRRERLQKERMINPFELARSYGKDGERLIELAMRGDSRAVEEFRSRVLPDLCLLLDGTSGNREEVIQLLRFFKAGSSKPELLYSLQEIIEPCKVVIDGKRYEFPRVPTRDPMKDPLVTNSNEDDQFYAGSEATAIARVRALATIFAAKGEGDQQALAAYEEYCTLGLGYEPLPEIQ